MILSTQGGHQQMSTLSYGGREVNFIFTWMLSKVFKAKSHFPFGQMVNASAFQIKGFKGKKGINGHWIWTENLWMRKPKLYPYATLLMTYYRLVSDHISFSLPTLAYLENSQRQKGLRVEKRPRVLCNGNGSILHLQTEVDYYPLSLTEVMMQYISTI